MTTEITAEEIKKLLGLQELQFEGGFFRQTYVSPDMLQKEQLPGRYRDSRPFATAVFYLLTADSFSAFHRLLTDEIYHHYLGDAAELHELHPDGSASTTLLGPDLAAGQQVQHLVPHGVWQGSRVTTGGTWTLLGTTMAPGYTQDDFELGHATHLISEFPAQEDLIRQLTRANN
ncbi:MAG: cupin domain-containing protein [Anaerolineales bacterium]